MISFLSDKEIQENLSKKYQKSVSTSTISRYLHEYSYRNVLPHTTHILIVDKKNDVLSGLKIIKMMILHITIFTDETSFQLFRNIVRRWTKNPNNELKIVPKNRQKC